MNRFSLFLKEHKTIALLVLPALVLIYFYVSFILSDQLQRLQQLALKLQAQEAVLQEASFIQEEIAFLEDQHKVFEQEAAFTAASIPPFRDIPGLTVGLYSLIQERDLRSHKLFLGMEKQEDRYAYYTVQFTVEGEKAKIYDFLQELEDYPRKLGYAELVLTSTDIDSLRAEIILEVYMLGDREDNPPRDRFFNGLYGYGHPLEMFTFPEEKNRTGDRPDL